MKRISVPVEVGDLDMLREMALKGERSVSWLAAQAIRAYLLEVRKTTSSARDAETPESE